MWDVSALSLYDFFDLISSRFLILSSFCCIVSSLVVDSKAFLLLEVSVLLFCLSFSSEDVIRVLPTFSDS